jgi:hypothetical protein
MVQKYGSLCFFFLKAGPCAFPTFCPALRYKPQLGRPSLVPLPSFGVGKILCVEQTTPLRPNHGLSAAIGPSAGKFCFSIDILLRAHYGLRRAAIAAMYENHWLGLHKTVFSYSLKPVLFRTFKKVELYFAQFV